MPNADDLIQDFMNDKKKELFGEKISNKSEIEKDNYLPEKERAKYQDTTAVSQGNEKAIATAKQTMSILMRIPLLFGGFISLLYIAVKMLPIAINMIRKFIIF